MNGPHAASVNPSSHIAHASSSYDAFLLVSFGGPEKPDDVIPFLENVVRGKEVSRQRLLEVAEHYELFGGVSPLNAQNRALLAALARELNAHGPHLSIYWGNRNWHPFLEDSLAEMADDQVRCALAFVTSAFGSYPSCRQYLEDIERACRKVGPRAPKVDKLRLFYNHPGFIESQADRVVAALGQIPPERRDAAKVVYTAHSLPLAMAARCAYQRQLEEACHLVSARIGRSDWQLVYQSRSGPPAERWLEPEIGDYLVQLQQAGLASDVVIVPIGFLAENMEVAYDLDVEIAALGEHLGLNVVRAAVVGTHPRFVGMIRDLIVERVEPQAPLLALGHLGPSPHACSSDCCPAF